MINREDSWRARHARRAEPRPTETERSTGRSPATVFAGILAALAASFGIGYGVAASNDEPAEVAPQACETALDHADEVIAIYVEGMQTSAEIMRAAGELDAAGVQEGTDQLDSLRTSRLEPEIESYRSSSLECRAP